MADVVLFHPYMTCSASSREAMTTTLPVNLLYLATYLKRNGIEATIYDLGAAGPNDSLVDGTRIRWGLSDAAIEAIVKKESPRIIGIGAVYSRHYPDVVALAQSLRKIYPSAAIVLGGNHATACWDLVLREPAIDYVVIGEGEITFLELIRALSSGTTAAGTIPGVACRDEKGVPQIVNRRELVRSLDDLPIPDYSLIDLERYIHAARHSAFHMRPPAMGIVSSRGCPGSCVYCTVQAVWGRTWRGRSPAHLVDEIEHLMNAYGFHEFAFLDDSASVDKKRWAGICDEIIRRKLDIRWTTPNGIAHWTLDRAALDKMKAAGCYRITFGIESGNTETRKFLGKPYSLDQARDMIQYANRIGMWTICTNILGFPYEDRQSINDTIRFAKRCGTDFAAFYLLSPLVTSAVYQTFKKEGLLDLDPFFSGQPVGAAEQERINSILNYGGAPTKHFQPEQLRAFQAAAYRGFFLYRALSFLNPLRLARKIRSMEDFRYSTRLLAAGFRMLIRSFYRQGTEAIVRS